jgi:hypothetical protein
MFEINQTLPFGSPAAFSFAVPFDFACFAVHPIFVFAA